MMIYIPMIFFSVFFMWLACHVTRRQKIIVLMISIAIPVVVAMLRYNNGADYLMYLRMMKFAERHGSLAESFSSLKSVEIGFWVLLKFCGLIWPGEYFLTYGVSAAIICSFIYVAIWQTSENPALSVYLFFATGLYFDGYNALRQYIAVAIVVYAYKYILEKDFKRYLIGITVAFVFHYSALIAIPFYFVRSFDINLKRASISALGCIVGGNIFYNIVAMFLNFTRYKYFLTSVEWKAQTQTSAIIFTSVISISTYAYIAWKKRPVSESFQVMMNIQLLPWCIALLSIAIPITWRVLYYVLPFEIFYIPAFLKEVKSKNARIIFTILFVLLYTVITIWGMTQKNWYNALPYNYYFNYM